MKRKGEKPQASSRAGGWLPSHLWPLLLVAAATVAVYANSLHNEFLFDDLKVIVEEQAGAGAGPFSQLLSLFRTGRAYRPLRTASYAFDYAVSGLDPWGYHLSNIAYHALAAGFVFLIARLLLGVQLVALFIALLFAVHPIQTDAVTYLSGRRDVLSGLFVLMGFYAFLRYRGTGRPRYLVVALCLYPMAFFSKESGIILPLLFFAYDVVHETRMTAPGFNRELPAQLWAGVKRAVGKARFLYLGLVVGTAGLAFYVVLVVRGTWQREYYGGSLWFTLLTDARIFLHYLKLLIFPMTLNADYSYNAFPVTTTWTDLKALSAVLVLAAIGCGLLSLLKDRRIAAFGGLWFFLALLPVAQIIPHHEMMAEHYVYLPSVGFFLVVGGLLVPLANRRTVGRALYAAGGVILVLLALRTVWRNRDWKDDLTLWTKTVQVAPQAARARNNLGVAYLRRGQLVQAEEQLEAAIQIEQDSPYAHGNLGKVHFDRGELVLAERELQTALRLKRDEVIPRLWLGGVYAQGGRMTEAEQVFRAVLTQDRRNAYAHNNLGALLARTGHAEAAAREFQEALRLRPGLREAQENLIKLYLLQGNLLQAEQAIQTRLSERPNDAMLHYYLALLYRRRGSEGLAARALEEALRLNPGLASAGMTLNALDEGAPQ